jgi:hypothetical protein
MQAGIDMKCFLATVFLALCAATANANIIYNVDHTFDVYTLTGTITTNGNTEGNLEQSEIVDWSLTLTGGENPIDILNVVIAGAAVSATETALKYDFSYDPLDPPAESTYLSFFNSNVPFTMLCLQTTGCSGGLMGPYEFVIDGSDMISETREGAGIVTFATVVPVPAAVWMFGSGLIGLAGFARRKR